jgi:predicted GNAT family acetyltransferase
MTEATGSPQQIPVVVDNPEAGQFETHVDGHVALVAYVKRGDTIIFTHTEVPKELQGRGLANVLAHAALQRAKLEGWHVVARCPFIASYIKHHPEYEPLLTGGR